MASCPGHQLCQQQSPVYAAFMQVQAENLRLTETLAKLATKVEQVDTDVRDTQKLLSALEGACTHSVWQTCSGTPAAAELSALCMLVAA